MLPQISPYPLTSLKEPISHPNCIFELKQRRLSWRAIRRSRPGLAVSRKQKKFHQFEPLLKHVLRSLKGQRLILVLDEKGRASFFDLMARCGDPR